MSPESAIAKSIQQSVEKKMSDISDTEIKNVEFQIAYSKAVAKSFVSIMTGPAVGLGSSPAFTVTTPFVVGLTYSDSTMSNAAFNYFRSFAPQSTRFARDFFIAVSTELAKEGKNIKVTSSNTFGGPVTKVTFPGNQMGSLILNELPQKFKKGRYIKPFCTAIGIGLQTAMLNATSQPVPNAAVGSPPPTGVIIAKFS